MKRPLGYLALLVAVGLAVASGVVRTLDLTGQVGSVPIETLVVKVLSTAAVLAGLYGCYLLVTGALARWSTSKRRQHDVRNVVRLVFFVGGTVTVLGVLTEQWLGVLFSLGVVGFAVTFALQQPLFSLIGWVYIVVKRPYQVGDRVAIEDSKGDVVDVDFLVTTLWEINGDLVSSNQPSGRTVTLPNSVVLSSHVKNYTREEFPYVWNEVTFQVSYETDLGFAREQMLDVAEPVVGEFMRQNIRRYRERLAETPVELEVSDGPSVNVIQQESWVELRLRFLVNPKRGQRTKNELYERILERFQEHPERVAFPVGRPR